MLNDVIRLLALQSRKIPRLFLQNIFLCWSFCSNSRKEKYIMIYRNGVQQFEFTSKSWKTLVNLGPGYLNFGCLLNPGIKYTILRTGDDLTSPLDPSILNVPGNVVKSANHQTYQRWGCSVVIKFFHNIL